MIPLSLLFSNLFPLGGGIIICKLKNPSTSILNDTLMAACNARFACAKSPKLYLTKRSAGQTSARQIDIDALAHEKLSFSEQMNTSITSLSLG